MSGSDPRSDSSGKAPSQSERLIAGIVQKDPSSLETFYDLYSSLLFSVIYKILMVKEESEEVLQEVFAILWAKAEQFKPELSSPLTWVTTIARNAAISKLKSSKYQNAIQTGEFQDSYTQLIKSSPDEVFQGVVDSSLRARIKEAIADLSPDISILLEEGYWGGLSQSEIAKKYGLPLGTVKSRIRTGLLELRDKLKDWS